MSTRVDDSIAKAASGFDSRSDSAPIARRETARPRRKPTARQPAHSPVHCSTDGADQDAGSAPPEVSSTTITRVVRLEVSEISDADRQSLNRAMRLLAWCGNRMTEDWVAHHRRTGTDVRLAAMNAWYAGGKHGARPLAIGAACPPELQKTWYHLLKDVAPELHQRPRDLLLNWFASTISSQDSPKVNRKRWHEVLLCRERAWFFEQELPVRLDGKNASIEQDGRHLYLSVRVMRGAEPIRLGILSPRNNDSHSTAAYREQWRPAHEVADGTRRLFGSQIIRQGRKFFLMLTVKSDIASQPADKSRTAVLRTGKRFPWRLRYASRTRGFGHKPLRGEKTSLTDRVSHLRQQVAAQRARATVVADNVPSRRDARQFGRGLRGRWNRCCTAINRVLARQIGDAVVADKIGKLTLCFGDGRGLLDSAGRNDGEYDPTSFPYHQFARFIREIVEPQGVNVVVRPSLRSHKRRVSRAARQQLGHNGHDGGDRSQMRSRRVAAQGVTEAT